MNDINQLLINQHPLPILIVSENLKVVHLNDNARNLLLAKLIPLEEVQSTFVSDNGNQFLEIKKHRFPIQVCHQSEWRGESAMIVFLKYGTVNRNMKNHLKPNLKNHFLQIRFKSNGELTFYNQAFAFYYQQYQIYSTSVVNIFDFFDIENKILILNSLNTNDVLSIEHEVMINHQESNWIQWKIYPLTLRGEFEALGIDVTDSIWNEKVQKSLYEISQATIQVNHLPDFYQHIHHTLNQIMPAKNLYIALLDQKTELLHFVYFKDEYDHTPPAIPIGKSLTGSVMVSGKSLLLSDYSDEDLYKEFELEAQGTASFDWLGVPLCYDQKTIGVLAIQTYDQNIRYTQKHLEVLEFVSNQIAQSIVRKKAEEALRLNEERYRALFDTYKDAVFLETKDGHILDANHAACLMYGYSIEELKSQHTYNLIPEEIHDQVPFILQQEQSQKHNQHENLGIRKNGEIFPTLVNTGLVNINDEEQVVVSIQDQSKEKDYEQRLFLQGKILKTIANAVVITDPKGTITWANDATTKLTGYDIDEILGKNTRLFNSGKHGKKFYQELWQTIQSGQVWKGEMINRHKNGHLYFEEMTITPIKNGDEKIKQFVAIKQDITERKQNQTELEAIAGMTSALRNAFTQDEVLEAILTKMMDLIDGVGVAISLLKAEQNGIMVELGTGDWRQLTGQIFPIGSGVSGYVINTGDIYIDNQAHKNKIFAYPELLKNVKAIGSAPLVVLNKIIGAMVIGVNREIGDEEIRLLNTISNLVSSVIHRASLSDQIQASYRATIQGWAQALELRNHETKGHSDRVVELTRKMGIKIGYPMSELHHLINGAILHDIGKNGIPDNILLKPGPLTDDEWVIMKMHPVYAKNMIENIPYLQPAIKIVHYHHEWWDGSGYPEGLKGTDIPLEARLFTILDVYDALSNDRPYRPAWPKKQVLNYIQDKAGIQFDPQLVKVFIDLINSEEK